VVKGKGLGAIEKLELIRLGFHTLASMRTVIVFLGAFLASSVVFGQGASRQYQIADSLYRAKEYKASAATYMKGIRLEWSKDVPNRMTNAAALWAMAGVSDSAFHLLKSVANSERVTLGIARMIQDNKDFGSLKTDKRWQPLVEQVVKKAASNYPQIEINYGRKDGLALTMIRVNPKGKSNGKAILLINAGSWISSYQSFENFYNLQSYMYLAKGFTVFNVLVGSQPRYTMADQVTDVKRAVRYVRYHAPEWGIDPGKIGITGYSAGGHLSLAVATADEKIDPAATDPVDRVSSRVQAAAVLYPPTDLTNWDGKGNHFINNFQRQRDARIFGAVDFTTWNSKTFTYDPVLDTLERNRIAKEVSPLYAVTPDDPPVFIIHGDADRTVPLLHSQNFIAKLNEVGVPNRFVVRKGGKHDTTDMNPELQEFPDWFDKYLK
jgi:acetyl esterase/lipase